MKTLQKTLGIVALVVLTAQTVRHAYLLWFEPRASVLDKYDQPLKDEIAAARSLDQLVTRYDPVRREADRAREQARANKEERISVLDEENREPFKSEVALREAIREWEEKTKELYSLRFYCLVGFCLLLAGAWLFRYRSKWLGVSLEIAAFSEFVYWTSPTLLGASVREFDRLLANKLLFSLLSLLLLGLIAWLQGVFAQDSEATGHA